MTNYEGFPARIGEETIRYLEMEKAVESGKLVYRAPAPRETLRVGLVSKEDGRTRFIFSVYEGGRRSSVMLEAYVGRKTSMQMRKESPVLARLDLDLDPNCRHTNPDGGVVTGPHLHIAAEGFGDRWAVPLSAQTVIEGIKGYDMPSEVFEPFKRFCGIDPQLSIVWDMGV